MAKSEKPYWMQEPGPDVLKRFDKIKAIIGDGCQSVRNITHKLYPDAKGKELTKKYNLTLTDTVRMRVMGVIGFEQIQETRTTLKDPWGFKGVNDFFSYCDVDDLSSLYFRDKHSCHMLPFEIWYEKESVTHIMEKTGGKYNVPTLCTQGHIQWSTLFKAVERLTKKHHILYFGDNDDKGREILDVIHRNLTFFRCNPQLVWAGITSEQEQRFNLPSNSQLDGLDFADIETIVEETVLQYINIDKYNKILEKEQSDKEFLSNYRLLVESKI